MKPFTSSSSSSSSSTSSNMLAQKTDQFGNVNREYSNYSNRISIRKPLGKPLKKPSIAPMPPTRPRVYKVDPINFRYLVQKLTGLVELQAPRFQNMAPPPLDIASRQQPTASSDHVVSMQLPIIQPQPPPVKVEDLGDIDDMSFLGLNLSPFTHSWCSFPLLSPEALAILDAI